MIIASRDNEVFETGIDTLTRRLDELGLTLEIERDFGGLGEFLASQSSFVNPTYDPKASDLGPEDFWIRLRDSKGETVACSAERTIWTTDFSRMVAQGTCWYRGGFADIDGPASIPALEGGQVVRGKIGMSGSTYTTQAWRRHGLALVMTWLTRLMSFRDVGTTINTGFVRHSLAQTTVPSQSYGYDHILPIIDGYFPPQRGPEKLYLCWIDRAGMARRIVDLPNHPTNAMPLAAPGAMRPSLRAA